MAPNQIMSMNLLIVSGLFILIGLYIIFKKKYILGSLLSAIGLTGVIVFLFLIDIRPHNNPFASIFAVYF